MVVQEQTMAVALTDDPASYAYRNAWQAVAAEYPHIAGLDKTERHYYAWMAENEGALREWRSGLTPKQKRAWNHPRTVYNHSPLGQAAKDAQKAASEPKARKSVTRELNTVADRLNDATDRIESKVSGVDLFDMSPELIGESARNFIEIFGAADTRRFIAELQTILEPAAEPEVPLDTAFTESVKQPRRPKARPRVHSGKRAAKPAATEVPAAEFPPGASAEAELPESACAVLAKLRTAERGLTAAELYNALGVYGITLDALVTQGWLVQDADRRYRLAPERSVTRVHDGRPEADGEPS
jgi:hypothetical protein